jgi:hypothetical protein
MMDSVGVFRSDYLALEVPGRLRSFRRTLSVICQARSR